MDDPLPRVFVVGDSISVQYGPFLKKMLAGRLHHVDRAGMRAALQNLDLPQGANGGSSERCLQILTGVRDTIGLDADLVLFNCGLHDIIRKHPASLPRQVEPDAYRANLEQLVPLVRSMVPEMMWIRTTPVDEPQHNAGPNGPYRLNEDVDHYNAIADDIMTRHGVPIIDLHAFTLSLGPTHETLHDGRHFTEPVQRLQAAYIAGYLERWRQGNWRG